MNSEQSPQNEKPDMEAIVAFIILLFVGGGFYLFVYEKDDTQDIKTDVSQNPPEDSAPVQTNQGSTGIENVLIKRKS